MAASEATIDALAKESRANAKEDLVTITSGAKEKVHRTLASARGVAEKIAHPLDKEARKRVDEGVEVCKAEVSAKQAALRGAVHRVAEEERLAARSEVADIVAQGRGGERYAQAIAPPELVAPPSNVAAEGYSSAQSFYSTPPQPMNSALSSDSVDVSTTSVAEAEAAPPHGGSPADMKP